MNGAGGKLGGNVAIETELKKVSITYLGNYRRSAEERGGQETATFMSRAVGAAAPDSARSSHTCPRRTRKAV